MSSKAQETLREEAKICHASIEWWKKEMSALINESDGLEENPQDYPDFEERMDRNSSFTILKGTNEKANNNLYTFYNSTYHWRQCYTSFST